MLSEGDARKIYGALRNNQKIEAIKRLREGASREMSLREAKELADRLESWCR